jgi:3-phenylpropionate/trans-cinnamate dioxygenase ferredoxin reductase component
LDGLWLRDGQVVAGMNVNVWDVAPLVERLVASNARVDPKQLTDPRLPLTELAPAA